MESRSNERFLEACRKWALVCFFVAAFLSGLSGDSILSRGLSRAAASMSIVLWCALDATLRKRHEVWTSQWQYLMTWPITVPAYVISTRKRAAVKPLLLTALGVVVASAVGAVVAAMLSPDE